MNTVIWLVRREFWENRAIWMIPAVIGGLMVLIALFGRVDLMSISPQMPVQAVGGGFLLAVGATFFAVMSIYSTWYLLDCLYADRKDRSVLFWKSMPISDTTTVLSKLATALIVIPVVYFAGADLTTLIMAFIVSVRWSASIDGALWHANLWLQLQLLPPLTLVLAERWFFDSHVIADVLGKRLLGYPAQAFRDDPGSSSWVTTVVDNDTITTPISIWGFFNVGGFFSSAETWIGIAVGAALIVCAIQLRTRRTEI